MYIPIIEIISEPDENIKDISLDECSELNRQYQVECCYEKIIINRINGSKLCFS